MRALSILRAVFITSLLTSCAIQHPHTTDVGVSVSVSQPGFYGRIDIGGFPQPQLIFLSPVIILRAGVVHEPIYLHVPPGHANKWSKHCHEYNACGQPVYFVQENWYNNEYVPQYRERHGKGKGKDKGKGKHDKD